MLNMDSHYSSIVISQGNEEICISLLLFSGSETWPYARNIIMRFPFYPPNRTHYFQLDVISNLVVIKWLLDGPSVWPIINMIIQSPLHYSVLYEMAVIQRECLDVCLGKGCRKLISSIQRGHNDSQQRVEHSKQLWGIADRVLIKALSLVKTSHTFHISLLKQATFKQTPTHVV